MRNVPLYLLPSSHAPLRARYFSILTRRRSADGNETDKPASSLANAFGFQSLSGLFQKPRAGRYSRPPAAPQEQEITESDSFGVIDPSGRPESKTLKASPLANDRTERTDTAHLSQPAPKPLAAPERREISRRIPIRKVNSPLTYHGSRTPIPNPWKAHQAAHSVSDRPQVEHAQKSANAWGVGASGEEEPASPSEQAQPCASTSAGIVTVEGDEYIAEEIVNDEPSPTKAEAASSLTHVTSSGEAHMVNISGKASTKRIAVARANVMFSNSSCLQLIFDNNNKKGDVLGVARIAGIMAAKRTSDLIPLCHPISITRVEVDVKPIVAGSSDTMAGIRPTTNPNGAITILALVECEGSTGVEMEALTAATGAALTVYDMLKAVDKGMAINVTRLVYKSGGRSGTYSYTAWLDGGGRKWLADRGVDETMILPKNTTPKPEKVR